MTHPYRQTPVAAAPARRSRLLATVARWLPTSWRWVRRAAGGHWETMPFADWAPVTRCKKDGSLTSRREWRARALTDCEDHGEHVEPYRVPKGEGANLFVATGLVPTAIMLALARDFPFAIAALGYAVLEFRLVSLRARAAPRKGDGK